MSEYRECTRCVMDTTSPVITFDSAGVCNHCTEAKDVLSRHDNSETELDAWLGGVKQAGFGQQYDCALGLSGGADSSLVALRAFDWGLRPLVVHVDTGWNSEAAVNNIQRLVDHCGFDLHTTVVNWDTMRRLQVAYLRSGISNQEVPQDHAIFAGLFRFAVDNGIRTVLSGHNWATESILPPWQGSALDSINLKAIFRAHGEGDLTGYPLMTVAQYHFIYPIVRRMDVVLPLNMIHYDKPAAEKELIERVGWRSYGRKHGESQWSRFFQNHYLPERFGYDKRRAHLSSEISNGTLSRAEAVAELEKPLYDEQALREDRDYIIKKLRLSREDWDELMGVPIRSHSDYRTWRRPRGVALRAGRTLSRLTRNRLRVGI